MDVSIPRELWPRGRIENLYPGKDGLTRVVDVVTSGGTLRRSLNFFLKQPTRVGALLHEGQDVTKLF